MDFESEDEAMKWLIDQELTPSLESISGICKLSGLEKSTPALSLDLHVFLYGKNPLELATRIHKILKVIFEVDEEFCESVDFVALSDRKIR